ncbi:helicase protein mom1 [Phtheirospermum japonicum]|uniref:Helicase protein mom1 n=1 Tax=Phtheirospermum japonicum TaxID=374723 RepID=A0A830BGK0_9LAMI|nr:helicase protein mom1 [Phtheirospermum japonicum]
MKNSSCHAIWKPSSSHPVKSTSEKLEKHNTRRRSEQSAKEVAQTEKAGVHQEAVGVKRKRMTGRAFFMSLLKKKRNNGIVPVLDEPPAIDHSDDSRTSSVVREIIDNSESVPTNCSPAKSKDVPKPETTACLIRLTDDAINSECETITPQSAECENFSLLGTCILCCKEKRICYNSQEKELCTCDATSQKDLDCSSTRKDRVDRGASQMDDHGTVCAVCNNDGKLLCCEGKYCKIRYHLSCLDPRLPDDLPGARHCPKCVNKKLKLGVHSVSEGVESIWDVRDVDVSKAKGIRQRQYLVKYCSLAHIHNHWVPEKQLLLKNQSLVSSFMTKDETARWSVDWTVPHRLLRKRPILDKFHTASSADTSESYEWLVKWKGLDYDHATWELDSSQFLSSSLGQDLMTEYEMRREKAKREVDKSQKGSVVELSELPASGVNVNDNFLLKNVNKLRECWCKSQNTVVFNNQDRAMTLVFFIRSLAEICHPFLIIAAPDSLSQWEAEFARLAPSVDVVVYNGNADTRKRISASEFYEEGGCVMLQVLLSSPEAVFEDIDMFSCIRWQSIVIDEYHQHSRKSIDLEQIKILTTDSRILLLSGQIKDTTSEYLNILSLLDSEHEYNKLRGLRSVKNDNLAKLKERLSRFIAYGSTSEVSKFLEYWVPIQISNHQLEQYCATLISNSTLLCSCSRNDEFGALRDILLTVRKCCDHPYLVDPSIQERMIAERRPAAELLNVGIKASSKLQLLEMMLTQVKARGLQVLVLFQSVGSGGFSAADIMDDFLAQKFGQNSYERVEARCSPTSKLAAVKRFNKKENGQFVLLLEKSACSSTIKISSLDVIIIYNSDWNPENDFRALQKLSIDLSVDQIKVFRLYSSCTVEERALVLAKKHLNLDNNLQASSSRAPSDSLLMWCASYLLNKLDDYHSERSSELNSKSGQSLLNEITEEFESILSGRGEMSKRVRVISRVKLDVGSYSADVPLLGEAKAQLIDVEEPHIFWKNLLDNRSPRWKHIMRQSPRNRKRVHYLDGSLVKSDTENDESGKKLRLAVVEDVYQAAAPVEVQEHQATHVAVTEEGPSRIVASSSSQSSLRVRDDMSGQSSSQSPEVDKCGDEEINASSDKQKSLHDSLQEETERLCQILKFSDDVNQTLGRFLEYVISNHPICRDSSTVMQAFQMSLLWVAASISKQEADKTELLNLAKKHLNYQCTEEQVQSVYSQMLDLKRMYLRYSSPTTIDCSSPEENTENVPLNSSSVNLKKAKTKTGENPANEGVCNVINEIQKKCDKRMKRLVQKQKREIEEVYRIWKAKKLKLETDHKLASALVRCIYCEGSARTTNLELLDGKFAKEMEANDLLKDAQLKDVEAKQLDARKEEREKADQWIAEAKACWSGQSAEEVGGNASVESPNDLIIITQPEFTGEIVCVEPPATGEAVPDEMGSVELNDEVPSPSEQAEASPQVPVDQIHRNLSSELQDRGAQVVEDGQNNFHIEVAVSETADSVTTSKSNSKLPDQDAPAPNLEDHGTLQIEDTNSAENGTVTPSQSNIDAQTVENCEQQLLHVSVDVSPSENKSMAIEVESQCHYSPTNSSRTTEAAETEILVEDQNTSESDSVTIPQSNSKLLDRDAPAPAVEDHGTLQIENSIVNPLQSNVDTQDIVYPSENRSTVIEVENQSHDSGRNPEIGMLPRESASTGANLEMQNNAVMSPNQAFLQLGAGLGDPITSWDSPTLFAKPLQIELENIQRKTEQLDKTHEEMRLRLKFDCEKEMKEMAAQVLKKYELKNQEAEAEYVSKKNGLDENRKKVFTNKLLAKAFSFICEDLQPSGLPGIKQDFPPSFMYQQLPQHPVGPPPMGISNFQAFRPGHVNNHHSSLEIRQALSPQLQAFRPAAPSFISQHNLQQRMLEWAAATNQIRPQHQGGPLFPWATFLRPVDRRSQAPGEPYFLGYN